ncbi:MAG TPA: hypothetical protein VHX61_06945 [Rhizomicrobium sp.]|nr:hypothetical protein [Rhizomicrobium sp.]
MIVDLPTDGPGWIYAAAESLLALVIGAGVASVCAGGAALLARNGGGLQSVAGRVFGFSLLVMSGVGAAAAPGVAAAGLLLSRSAVNAPVHAIDGELAQCFYLYLLVGATAAALDIRSVLQGGIAGAHRFARQLWRLCVALFLGAGSFFLGQQKLLPALLRGTPLLFVPALAPLVLVGFWLLCARVVSLLRGVGGGRSIAMAGRAA